MFGARLILLMWCLSCAAEEQWSLFVAHSYRVGDAVKTELPFAVSDDAASARALQLWIPDTSSTDWLLYLSDFRAAITGGDEREFALRHAQFGGVKATQSGVFTPFVGATVGAASIDADNERQLRWSYTLVGGMRWHIAPHCAVLAEARWLGILFNSATQIACDDQHCRLQFDSGTWSQYEIALALGVRF